jgi:hypothetical protein
VFDTSLLDRDLRPLLAAGMMLWVEAGPRRNAVAAVIAVSLASVGCTAKRTQRNPLPPAGDFLDYGGGWLARSSIKIDLSPTADESPPARNRRDEEEPSETDVDSPWQTARPSDSQTTGGVDSLVYKLPSNEPTPRPSYVSVDRPGETLRGRFVWGGKPPAPNPRCPGSVTRDSSALAGTVIQLRKAAFINAQLLSSLQQSQTRETSVSLRPCGWVPSLTVLHSAAVVRVASETEATNATITSPDRTPLIADISAGDAVTMTVGTGTTAISSLHRWPAFVHSVDTPLYAITDDQGLFQIDNVIAGNYELVVWHAPIVVRSKADTLTWGEPLQSVRQISLPLAKGASLTVSLRVP